MTARLYCFGESGNAYKVALTLELAGLAWEPVFVDFFNGGARSAEFRALNPMGEVPVLIDGDTILTQSGVIADYVAEKTGRFGASDQAGKREIWRWVLFDNHKLSGVAGALRFNMNFLAEDKRNPGAEAWMALRLRAALKVLDGHLAGRDWVAGEAPTVADFACCGYLYYPEPFTFDRAEHPAIDRWLDRIAALPGWRQPYDLMPGSPSDRGRGVPR